MNKNSNEQPKTLIFTDFDGTLYDPSYKIILSPFYNAQTTKLLQEIQAEFIIVTGRPSWTKFDEIQLRLLRLPRPRIVIFGAGTHILTRSASGYEEDTTWLNIIRDTKVVWADPMAKMHIWQKYLVEETLQPILDRWHLAYKQTENPFMSIIPITNFQVKQVKQLLDQLKMLWKSGIKMILTEKLYLPNSTSLFNGYLLLLPEQAGKDNAVQYLLENMTGVKPDVLFFGDALIDVPMLSMDTSSITNTSYSYGVHMTPLALENMKIEDPKSKIVHFEGSAPKAFRDIIKAYVTGKPIAAQQHAKLVEPT